MPHQTQQHSTKLSTQKITQQKRFLENRTFRPAMDFASGDFDFDKKLDIAAEVSTAG
jgi:hypothetical protein